MFVELSKSNDDFFFFFYAGRKNRHLRYIKRYDRYDDVLCLEKQKLPDWSHSW